MTRVGIILNFDKNKWRGGHQYIKNLLECLKKLPNKKIYPVIITDHITKNISLRDLKTQVIKTNLVKRTNFVRILHKILIILFNKNFFLDQFLKKNKINIISHFYFLGKKSSIKSINWIPDFQEINTPEYLDFRKKFFRKLNLYLVTNHSSKILLSSYTVQNDLKKLSNIGFKKSEVIRPFFSVLDKKQLTPYSELKKKNKIKNNYFFLPNQYWVHKNHLLVLESLKELKKRKKNVFIISTGTFNDFRNPKYKYFIKDFIKENNLDSNYKILGIIPYKDVLSLMYFSIAIINPSKSEGWSSTVEQAKSYGKMVLLSNIKVHIEQKPKRNFFFNTNDKKKLANKLSLLDKKFKIKKELKIMSKEYLRNKIKEVKFAENYQNLILRTLN